MHRPLLACLLLAGCGAPPTDLGAHQPARVLGAIDSGPVARDESIELVLGIRLRDASGLHTMLAALERGQEKPISPAEFAARFAVGADEYQRVVDWATASGLEVTRAVPGRTTLTVRGRAEDVERAFGTRLETWVDGQGSFRAPTADFVLPESIGQYLTGVVGLDTANLWHHHHIDPPATPNAAPPIQTPAMLRALYQFDQVTQHGEGETVGILGTGYPPDATPCPAAGSCTRDVDGFSKKYGLGINVPAQLTQVFLGGPNRDSDAVANNEYGENLLDIDMVFGLAPAASVVHVFTATNTPGLFSDGITFFINQVPQAHAVSVSYGSCERVAIGEVNLLNTLFAQAKAEGQQWFFASGDDGTDACRDGKPNKVVSVNWPSSVPYVISVGGTELQTGEVAWSGGGGGQSEIIPKPAYQTGVGPYPNDGVRDQPDVAALAGSPGVVVYAQGQTFALEGTSAATPMWAAAWAILDQAKGGSGFPMSLETLYKVGATGLGFHDITSGDNSNGVTPGYPAQAGYDLATGWGSPSLAQLIANWN
jgi:kumamolisin